MTKSATLFDPGSASSEVALPAIVAVRKRADRSLFAAVAIERAIDRMLDYSIPPGLVPLVAVGQRVRVPLGKGNRRSFGYIVALRDHSEYPNLKDVSGIEDDRVLIEPRLMELARWMSTYYVTALGTVLDTILPSAVRRRIGLGYTQMVRLAKPREEIQSQLESMRARKRRAVLARLLLLEPDAGIDIVQLASDAGTTTATVRKLAQADLIRITPEADLAGLGLPGPDQRDPASGGDLPLNPDQQRAVDELGPRVRNGGFSVNLLYGVTGSGKTEVYLRCIRQSVDSGKRAIVLVPEIALTPQTVRRFTARFDRVAVLHSGLNATSRHRFWQQIASGRAQVVVGARSAIFAPTPDLGVIVVDEEHEASYKQDQAPRYQARDIAIKRAQLQNIPVILGTATPSLETYSRVAHPELRVQQAIAAADPLLLSTSSNPAAPIMSPAPATDSRYHLLRLPNRVRDLPLAKVDLVDMKHEVRARQGVHLLSRRLETLLTNTLAADEQAILLLNRRGYSNFVYCTSCTNVVQCEFCDATMTYHRSAAAHARNATTAEGVHTGQLHCHYCLSVVPLPQVCPQCGKKLSLFGLGTQRVEEEITRKFPNLRFARVDSDSMRDSRDYESTLARFAKGEIQMLLGTQMIAKGLDYPNVTLVGVINGDTALALPDFRAAERTFQLITQVAGRAGRGDKPGRVVVQTFLPDDPTIRAAINQDYASFATTELRQRHEVGLPPYARMVRIVLREQDADALHKRAEELFSLISAAVVAVGGGIRLRGPMPCPITRIAGYYRDQIVMLCSRAGPLQAVLARIRAKAKLAGGERLAVDVDPVSLL